MIARLTVLKVLYENLHTEAIQKIFVGVQSTKNFGEWRGAAKFYMLRKRSEQRSNSNQTSVFRTSETLLSLTQVHLNVFRRVFT